MYNNLKKSSSNIEITSGETGAVVKSWTKNVPFEDEAKKQLLNLAKMPFIHKWLAVMPDVHSGSGSTIGSVIPTVKAIIPASVGVDIGCGMMACKTSLKASDLPENLRMIRDNIELRIPVGLNVHDDVSKKVESVWEKLDSGFKKINETYSKIDNHKKITQLGTLGNGNHFVELCLDENENVWAMLHSGSRGIGHAIGRYFIEKAKKEMKLWHIQLPDSNLAYLPEGSQYFKDYVFAVNWAQEYAKINRVLMMDAVMDALRLDPKIPEFTILDEAINCHHNYVELEHHYGRNVYVTRKGAVRARKGDLGIIPGSMGAKSFIVEGLGNEESFNSCSHGAGRVMSRTEAKEVISLDDHINATRGVECRKDIDVIDESPKAYKNIDDVMKAQDDLVKIKHTLKQIVCIKG